MANLASCAVLHTQESDTRQDFMDKSWLLSAVNAVKVADVGLLRALLAMPKEERPHGNPRVLTELLASSATMVMDASLCDFTIDATTSPYAQRVEVVKTLVAHGAKWVGGDHMPLDITVVAPSNYGESTPRKSNLHNLVLRWAHTQPPSQELLAWQEETLHCLMQAGLKINHTTSDNVLVHNALRAGNLELALLWQRLGAPVLTRTLSNPCHALAQAPASLWVPKMSRQKKTRPIDRWIPRLPSEWWWQVNAKGQTPLELIKARLVDRLQEGDTPAQIQHIATWVAQFEAQLLREGLDSSAPNSSPRRHRV